jgi:putative nucleotidyltransferase with HDIG domain
MEVFRKHAYRIYLVGGGVRDLMTGISTDNWDFATDATPEQVMELFPDAFLNNTFGTVGIPIEHQGQKLVFEVTPFRKESKYTDFRHPETVEWTDNIDEDLARRDFTINAMAFDGKELYDPYNGAKDLTDKRLVAVGDPDIRFKEDALRLMRAIRFATRFSLRIETNTADGLARNAELITKISWERIRDELIRILSSDYPAEGILLLRKFGILKFILPELDMCFSVEQKSPQRHHKYDVGTHLVMSLKHCPSKDPITRLATLLHDVGKASTYRKEPDTGVITFYNHEVVGEKQVAAIAERLRLSNKQKEKLVTLVANHQFTVSELQTDKAVRRFIRKVGKDHIQDMLDLRTGDRLGSGAKETSWRYELFKKRIVEVQQEPFTVKDLKVDGHDVMEIYGIPPSRRIGDILDALFDEVVEHGVPNERDILLEKLKEGATAK